MSFYCCGAGTGKTRIAVELIAAALPALRAAGQSAVFLAPSVPLVRQVGMACASLRLVLLSRAVAVAPADVCVCVERRVSRVGQPWVGSGSACKVAISLCDEPLC